MRSSIFSVLLTCCSLLGAACSFQGKHEGSSYSLANVSVENIKLTPETSNSRTSEALKELLGRISSTEPGLRLLKALSSVAVEINFVDECYSMGWVVRDFRANFCLSDIENTKGDKYAIWAPVAAHELQHVLQNHLLDRKEFNEQPDSAVLEFSALSVEYQVWESLGGFGNTMDAVATLLRDPTSNYLRLRVLAYASHPGVVRSVWAFSRPLMSRVKFSSLSNPKLVEFWQGAMTEEVEFRSRQPKREIDATVLTAFARVQFLKNEIWREENPSVRFEDIQFGKDYLDVLNGLETGALREGVILERQVSPHEKAVLETNHFLYKVDSSGDGTAIKGQYYFFFG